MTHLKLASLGRHAIRLACISVALCVVAPLLPGIEFHGSALSAVAAGAGLLLVFEASRFLVHRRYGVGHGACPTPTMQRKLLVWYVVLSVVYGVTVTSFGLFGFAAGIIGGAGAGFIALIGAVVSNVFERLLLGDPYAR